MQIKRLSGPQPDLLSHGYGAHWDDPDNARFNTDQYRRTDSIGMALMRDGDKFVASTANDGIVGAVAFRVIRKCDFGFDDESLDEALLVDNIGSVEKGAGSVLMKAVETEAKRLGLEVLIAPTRWSTGFYERLGYDCSKGYCVKSPGQLGESLMRSLLEAISSGEVYLGTYFRGEVKAVRTPFKQESGEYNTHTLHQLCYGERWRFPTRGTCVIWWEEPTVDAKEAVFEFLRKRGFQVKSQGIIGGTWSVGAGSTWFKAAHGTLNEGSPDKRFLGAVYAGGAVHGKEITPEEWPNVEHNSGMIPYSWRARWRFRDGIVKWTREAPEQDDLFAVDNWLHRRGVDVLDHVDFFGHTINQEPLAESLLESVDHASRFVRFGQLPEDMQQLLHDFVDCDESVEWDALEQFKFPLYDVPTALFPRHQLGYQVTGGDSRDEAHALAIPIDDCHPVVLVGNEFVDGRHRLYKASRTGLRTVPAINLTDIGVGRAVNSMGSLKRRFF